MVTKLDKIKWELWKKKNELLIRYGASRGLVRKYDDELIENLRHVYYGGIPASIILLCPTLCEGRCYDRALLMTLGFGEDDFKLVDADVDQDIKNADIESDKYALPITLPNLEAIITSEERGLYVERLRYELELFKEQIGYDDICRELEEDKKRPKGYAGGQQW